MKKILYHKLCSRTGASITLALLAFLVCAVVCSVIITAATTSAGRMSGIAEADQRYYAVSSAAELLQKLIDGKTVSIVKVEKSWTATTYQNGVITGTTSASVPDGEHASLTYIVPDKNASEIGEADDFAVENLVGDSGFVCDSIPKDAAKNVNTGTALPGRELMLSSDFYSSAGVDYDSLAVSINEKLDTDGKITLTLNNTYQKKDTLSSAGSRYTLILTFGADRSVSTSKRTENVSSTAVDDHTYNVETKTTETTITTLTWHLTGMKTGS